MSYPMWDLTNIRESKQIKEILQVYETLFGEAIDFQKTKILSTKTYQRWTKRKLKFYSKFHLAQKVESI